MPAKATALRRVGNRLASAKSKTGLPQCSQAASAWARHQATAAVFAILARCRAAAKLRGHVGLERRLAGEGGSEAKAQHLEHRIERGMAEGTLTGKERTAKAKELRAKLGGARHARAMRHPHHEGPAIPESRRTVAVAARTVKAHGPIPASKLHQVESIRLSGNTYAHRERIAAMGATWDAGHKSWVVPGHAIRPALHSQIARDLADLHKGGVKVEADLAMVHRKAKFHPTGTLATAHIAKVVHSAPNPKSPTVKAASYVAPVPISEPKPATYPATRLRDLTKLTAHFIHGAVPSGRPMEGRRASLGGGRPVTEEPWAYARLAAIENRIHARVKAAEAEVESNPLVGGKRARPGYAVAARKLDRVLARQKKLARARTRLYERSVPGYSRGAVYTGD